MKKWLTLAEHALFSHHWKLLPSQVQWHRTLSTQEPEAERSPISRIAKETEKKPVSLTKPKGFLLQQVATGRHYEGTERPWNTQSEWVDSIKSLPLQGSGNGRGGGNNLRAREVGGHQGIKAL